MANAGWAGVPSDMRIKVIPPSKTPSPPGTKATMDKNLVKVKAINATEKLILESRAKDKKYNVKTLASKIIFCQKNASQNGRALFFNSLRLKVSLNYVIPHL